MVYIEGGWLGGGSFDPWERKRSSDSEKTHPSTRALSLCGPDDPWEGNASVMLTPKFGKESDLWVQLGEESVRWKEGFFRCIRQKNPRSAICFRSAREQLS
jgi:hypothetical protein